MTISFEARGNDHELDSDVAIAVHNCLVEALYALDDLQARLDCPLEDFESEDQRSQRLDQSLHAARNELQLILRGKYEGRGGPLVRQANGVIYDIVSDGIPDSSDHLDSGWLSRVFNALRYVDILTKNSDVEEEQTVPERRSYP